MGLIFSQRYRRALADGRITVDLSDEFRRKLWAQLRAHDDRVCVQRDPNDPRIEDSSVLAESADALFTEHGWDQSPGPLGKADVSLDYTVQRLLVMSAASPIVFDYVELAFRRMEDATKAAFKSKLNGLFDLLEHPWRFTDGEFFKLDADFVGARLADEAHSALTIHNFDRAAREFGRARRDAVLGEPRDAILQAAKSFESVLQVLTGLDTANADALIRAFIAQGYLDDLPAAARAGFGEQILKTLPSLRNRLAGPGKGSTLVQAPQAYGELALQLAAAFHNFLIAKHLQRQSPASAAAPREPFPSEPDDDIPF